MLLRVEKLYLLLKLEAQEGVRRRGRWWRGLHQGTWASPQLPSGVWWDIKVVLFFLCFCRILILFRLWLPNTVEPEGPVMLHASGPLSVLLISYSTYSPSSRDLKPALLTPDWCTKISSPFSPIIEPQPFFTLNHFTCPTIRLPPVLVSSVLPVSLSPPLLVLSCVLCVLCVVCVACSSNVFSSSSGRRKG